MIENVRSHNEAAARVNPAPNHYIEGQEVPAWVRCTPQPETYGLVMHEGGGAQREGLDLTREEYLMLKRHLAVSRKFPPTVITVEKEA